MPFNLEESDDDIYTKDGNEPIYFKSVLNELVSAEKIQDYFSRNHGPIHFLWIGRNFSEFCLVFISREDKQRFEKELREKLGLDSSVVGRCLKI